MSTEVHELGDGELLLRLREAFSAGDFDMTASLYKAILERKMGRASRVEATCLAARALVAANQRHAARALLKGVMNGPYKKAVHYEFIARALLDLKQYGQASETCRLAAELAEAEAQSKP